MTGNGTDREARARARAAARAALDGALSRIDTRARVERAAAGRAPGAGPVLLLGAGKAAVEMAAGVAAALGDRIRAGLIVTKDGHAAARAAAVLPAGVEVREAAHPLPDGRSVAAGRALRARLEAAPADVPVIFVLSGGASSLAAVPASGLDLADKVAATRAVAGAGASIAELNTVRKHLSAIKGGRLGALARGAVTALVVSDVLGDDLATIGGGLLAPDPTTFGDALAASDRLGAALPAVARAALEAGARGERDETPKPGDDRLARIEARIVAGPDDLVDAAVAALEAGGVAVAESWRRVEGPVEALAARLVEGAARLAVRAQAVGRPLALVAGGEPTVRLPAAVALGRGGRAQHAALLAAIGLAAGGGAAVAAAAGAGPAGECAVLCAASDGTDGPTADAGGLVDAGTVARARAAAGIEALAAAAGFDAGAALAAAGDLVTTGPTGTNVCDLFVVVAWPL